MAQAQANGRDRVGLKIGPDGMPVLSADARPESRVKIFIPHNGREAPPADLVPDLRCNGAPEPSPPADGDGRVAELKRRMRAETEESTDRDDDEYT